MESRGVEIAYLSTMYHTSHILKAMGWIEGEVGRTVRWRLSGTGPEIVRRFEKGDLHIAYIGLPPVMMAIDRGVRLKCVAGGHVNGTVVIGRPDFRSLNETGSLRSTLEQFAGRRIGTPLRGSIHDVILRDILAKAGLANEVTVKNYEWADFIPDAMMREEIDAAAGTPPLAVLCQQLCQSKVIIPPTALWPNNPSYGIVVRDELIEDDPLLVQQFLRLHKAACAMLREDRKQAARIVAGAVKLVDEEFVMKVFNLSPRYCAAVSRGYVEATMAFVPVLKDLGYIKGGLSEEDVFDHRFMPLVHPEPAHY